MKRTSYIEGIKLFPVEFVGHHAQGAGAAVATLAGGANEIAAAAVWTGLYVAYQALTRIRKGDAAGLDVADYIAGFGAGIVGYSAWGMLT